jgi:putative phosphoribosyl transferase
MIFFDRRHAGAVLAEKLDKYKESKDLSILALPRGGVPVAFEVARALHSPLDIFLVRKLGFPDQPELAMGAIASGDICILNNKMIDAYGVPRSAVEQVIATERAELDRRERVYRIGREYARLPWRFVMLIDDGLATGATMAAAVEGLRKKGCQRIVVAVPVGAPDTCEAFRKIVDDLVCTEIPPYFGSVGQWYEDFSQTTDEEVLNLLTISRQLRAFDVA